MMRCCRVAVGEHGKILMFRGNINAPIEVASPTLDTLRAVAVESEYSAWAVGDGGTILHWDGSRWWPVATATRVPSPLNAIWADPSDGVWIGGAHAIISRHPTAGGSLYESDVEIRAIWARHGEDMWLACSGRQLMRWDGEACHRIGLPGDPDEEWTAICGSDAGTFLFGPSGFALHHDGGAWTEWSTDTTDVITGAVCTGSGIFVTTDAGQVRRWDGRRWTTAAFSAFGALRSICYAGGIIWACGDRGVVIQHRPDDGE